MVELRAGTAADFDAVLDLNSAAVPAVSTLDAAGLAGLVDQARALVVADAGDGLAGFLMLLDGPGRGYDSLNYAWFSSRFSSFLYVDRVVVGPDSQRQGIGRQFYEYAIELGASEYPVLCAEVNTRPLNQQSLDFHDTFGFESVGSQDTEGGTKTVRMLARSL
jgi:predicted GNAT superfamily acetyltransferase